MRALAIPPDGSWLATAGTDGRRGLWALVTGQPRAALTCPLGVMAAVAIAPDGNWLATAGSDGEVRIWDAATGKPRTTPNGHGPGDGEGIAPDGSGWPPPAADGTARICNEATGQSRASLKGLRLGVPGWRSRRMAAR